MPVVTDVMQRDVQALSLEQPLLQGETVDEALSELPQAVSHFGVWTHAEEQALGSFWPPRTDAAVTEFERILHKSTPSIAPIPDETF